MQFGGLQILDTIKEAIDKMYKGDGNGTALQFYQKNSHFTIYHPSKVVYSVCAADFFRPAANCREKALYCKRSINHLIDEAINHVREFDSWTKSDIFRSDFESSGLPTAPALSSTVPPTAQAIHLRQFRN